VEKRLKEELQKSSLHKYIQKAQPSAKLLKVSLAQLGHTTLSTDKDELITLLKQQVTALGIEYIFHQLPIALLRQMTEDANLEIKTSSKNLLVRHLVDMRDYIPAPRKNTQSPKKPSNVEEKRKSSSGGESKQKRKLKPEDIEIWFDSDDSTEWNPKEHKIEDITIKSEEDAEQEGTSDEEEDIDDEDYREYGKKTKKRRTSESGKKKHRSPNTYSYSDSGSDHEDSKKKNQRKSISNNDQRDEKKEKSSRKKSRQESTSD